MDTQSTPQPKHGSIGLNTIEVDTIGEILNISMGAAATAISLMLNRQVVITTPSVRVISPETFEFSRLEPALGIEIEYIEGLHGSNVMIMSVKDANAIVGLLLADSGGDSMDEQEMDELRSSALGEIMNQMMGASSTALATFLNRSINISPPTSFQIEESPERFSWIREQEHIVVVGFRFVVEDLLDSEFVTVMPVEFTRDLVRNAMSMDEDEAASPATMPNVGKEDVNQITGHMQIPNPMYEADFQNGNGENTAPEYAAPAARAPAPPAAKLPAPPRVNSTSAPRKSVNVQMLQFGNLDEDEGTGTDQVNLDLVMDIDLNLVVEIGRIKKLVRDIVSLRQGSIVELDKQASEPMDILVNGKLIARGDVVVIDDNFGVRITEIVGTLPST